MRNKAVKTINGIFLSLPRSVLFASEKYVLRSALVTHIVGAFGKLARVVLVRCAVQVRSLLGSLGELRIRRVGGCRGLCIVGCVGGISGVVDFVQVVASNLPESMHR